MWLETNTQSRRDYERLIHVEVYPLEEGSKPHQRQYSIHLDVVRKVDAGNVSTSLNI